MKIHRRIIAMGDLHCGHGLGITPKCSAWNMRDECLTPITKGWVSVQAEFWAWYEKKVKAIRAQRDPDFVVVNGDAVEGVNKKNVVELVGNNTDRQRMMAALTIRKWGKEVPVFMTYGTPWHTGEQEDAELALAESIKADIRSRQFFEIKGRGWKQLLVFRHHVGAGSLEHTRGTPIAREKYANTQAFMDAEEPAADWLFFSHVHYAFNVGVPGQWQAMSLPAMRVMLRQDGGKYSRRLSGRTTTGFTVVDVMDNGLVIPTVYECRCKSAKVEVHEG